MEAAVKVLRAQRSQCITWLRLQAAGSVGIFNSSCSFRKAAAREKKKID
jgi:hypothetical protein